MKSKSYILFLSGAFLLTSCGATRYAPEQDDIETHNIGITQIDRRSNTTSITTVDRDESMDNGNVSILDMLRRVPGVVVGGGNSITIRGASSIHMSTEPLFVVDGMTVGTGYQAVSALNPNNINRISVLKGPAASIYGVRAANGVIVIEMKSAKMERRKVN